MRGTGPEPKEELSTVLISLHHSLQKANVPLLGENILRTLLIHMESRALHPQPHEYYRTL